MVAPTESEARRALAGLCRWAVHLGAIAGMDVLLGTFGPVKMGGVRSFPMNIGGFL